MGAQGTRVATGRLRVDAARAVDKLREYQLPDPVAWVLEVVRAAAAFGATEIRVSGDADDVRVAWDGPAPDAESMAHLFDELVDPAPRAERRAVRLLATGVNTALGLDPRWVDLVTTDGSGGAFRVRYTASLLETTGGSAEGLRALSADEVRPPLEAPNAGGLVHLKRLPLWDAVPLMVGYGEPRELSIVRQSCDDMKTPIVVAGSTLGVARSHADLLRLRLGDGLDGFLALVEPSTARRQARLDVAELGVVLARYTLPLSGFAEPRAPVPIRLFVDAPRMPTNASRSAVRLDDSPVRDALGKADELFVELVKRLAKELGDEPDHAWSPLQRERLRAAALCLLATSCAGQEWRSLVLGMPGYPTPPPALAPLRKLPLVRDALGRPRSLDSFPMVRGAEWVHLGADPLDRELEPWLGDALWVPPGDPSARLLGWWEPPKASKLARRAKRYRRRRHRFLGQRKRKPHLERSRHHLVVVPLRAPGKSVKSLVPSDCFELEGLEGEVALVDPHERSEPLSLLIDGREIAQWFVDTPLTIAGVATCAGLTPKVDYSGIEPDPQLGRLQRALRAGLVVACESLALGWIGKTRQGDPAKSKAKWLDGASGKDAERITATLRAGVIAALELYAERSTDVDVQSRRDAARNALSSSKSPLVTTPIWPKVGGGRVSTRAIFGQGHAPPRVLGYLIGRASGGPAPAGARPVFELASHEYEALRAHLPAAIMIPYAAALTRGLRPAEPGELARLASVPMGAALELSAPGVRAAIAIGGTSARLEVRHWGRVLARHGISDAKIAMTVIVEDARVVPDERFSGIREVAGVATGGDPSQYPIGEWLIQLAKAYIDALSGDNHPNLYLGAEAAIDSVAARDSVLELIRQLDDPETMFGKKRIGRLRNVPLVKRLGLAGYTTLTDVLRESADDSLDWSMDWVPVSEAAGVDLDGWHPIVATQPVAEAFAKILGRQERNGEERLEGLRKVGRRNQALAAHRMLPERDPTVSWTGVVVEVKGQGIRRAVATPSQALGASVTVHIEGRPFRDLILPEALPIALYLDLPPSAADEEFRDIGEIGHRRLKHALVAGARTILTTVARDTPRSLTRSPEILQLLDAWCVHLRAHSGGNSADRRARQKIADATAFPSVQGGYASLADAAAAGGDTLRVARWDEGWIGPLEGERPSAYDDPVLDLVDGRDEYRAILSTLWEHRPTRDVTNAISRLQSSRRVASGLVRAPRLPTVRDPRFRYPLSDLLDEENAEQSRALEALGVGEVTLAGDEGCKVYFFARGRLAQTIELALVPSVHIATHSPLVRKGEAVSEAVKKKIDAAVQTLIGLVVRRVVDETPPDQLPLWVRADLRTSSLRGGGLYFERLLETPMFETSEREWVTPEDVRDQVARFGSVWTTTLQTAIAPLDPLRIALRLSKAEAKQLHDWMPTLDANSELAWDQEARTNMDRPAVSSLEPDPLERMSAMATVSLERTEGEGGPQGTVTLLVPGSTITPGLHVSRALRPLGTLETSHTWPVVARIDEPALTPNRTWSAPEHDSLLATLRTRVRMAVDRKLAELVPQPFDKLVAMRFRTDGAGKSKGSQGSSFEAVVHLEAEVGPGALNIRDARGEYSFAAADLHDRALPLYGTVLAAESLGERELRELCAQFYRRLLVRLGQRLVANTVKDRDAALLHLLTAIHAGAEVPDEAFEKVMLEMFVLPGPQSVLDVRRHVVAGGFVAVCDPSEVDDVKNASLGIPVLANDGSDQATTVLRWLGGRALEWRAYMKSQLLGGVELQALGEVAAEDEPAPRHGSAKPVPKKALHPLAEAIMVRWSSLPTPDLKHVVIDGRKKRPAAVWDASGQLLLAGKHPAIRAAKVAAETRSADLDARVSLIVARGIGSLRRDAGRLGGSGEESLMIQLMLPLQ